MTTPIDKMRDALEYIATHDSSDWPERCREIVRRARAVLSEADAEPAPALLVPLTREEVDELFGQACVNAAVFGDLDAQPVAFSVLIQRALAAKNGLKLKEAP